MNKKTMVMVLLAVFLVTVLAAGAEAAFKDAMDTVFKSIENFFASGWKNYEKALAFFLVFFLFFSSFLIGAKKAFGEISKPVIVFCFAAAAISGGILIVTNKFTLVQFGYVAFGLLFLMVTSAFYAMLMKVGLENHKFAAFFIAFFITGTIFFVGYLLSQKGGPLQFGGDLFGWLNDVTASFKGKGGGDAGPPAKGGFLPEGQAPKNVEKGWIAGTWDKFDKSSTGTKATMGGAVVAFMVIIALIMWNRNRGRRQREQEEEQRSRQTQPRGPPPELTYERLLQILNWGVRKKEEMVINTQAFIDARENFQRKFKSLQEEIKKRGGIDKFIEEFSSWLLSLSKPKGKDVWNSVTLKMFGQNYDNNHTNSIKFAATLREFAFVEKTLEKNLNKAITLFQGRALSYETLNRIGIQINLVIKSCQTILTDLKTLFDFEHQEEAVEEDILANLSDTHLEERKTASWLVKESWLENSLGKLMAVEEDNLNNLKAEFKRSSNDLISLWSVGGVASG